MRYNSGDTERSSPHRRVERILEEMGVNYMSEERFPPYKVDILLPEFWAAIEIDGPFHSRNKDKVRDQYLLEYYNLPILRLNARRWTKKQKYIDQILSFMDQHLESAITRKQQCQIRL